MGGCTCILCISPGYATGEKSVNKFRGEVKKGGILLKLSGQNEFHVKLGHGLSNPG
jgi:hypothetical protein